MSEYKIAVIVGSLRRDSFNRKLAGGLMKLGPPDFSKQKPRVMGGIVVNDQMDPRWCRLPSERRLPRGIGVTRLRDAPAEWARQYAMLSV